MHPHPALAPLREYLDMYDVDRTDDPVHGDWVGTDEELPYMVQAAVDRRRPMGFDDHAIRLARRAFYALCTHIDHQLRVVIGTLREEGLLDNTIIMFSSDHGDMLGNHGLWAKGLFYEGAANIPMILSAPPGDDRVRADHVDNRLVGLQDVMPTLLELAGIPVPETVEGLSLVGEEKRPIFYGEFAEGSGATRMIHDGRYKLIYYPVGNQSQLFDIENDPAELRDLAASPDHAEVRNRLLDELVQRLYGSDTEWLSDGKLVGLPAQRYVRRADRGLANQRGLH